jgi:hypothetical protein
MIWACENDDPSLTCLLCTFRDALSEEGKIRGEYPLKLAFDFQAHFVVYELLCRSNCTWKIAQDQLGKKMFDLYAIEEFLLPDLISKRISQRIKTLKERESDLEASTPANQKEKSAISAFSSVSPSNEALVQKALRSNMLQTLITLLEKLDVNPSKALAQELCLYVERNPSPALIKALSRILLVPEEQLHLLQCIDSNDRTTVQEIYQRISLRKGDETTKQIVLTCMEWVLENNAWKFGRDIMTDLNDVDSPWRNDCILIMIARGNDVALSKLL